MSRSYKDLYALTGSENIDKFISFAIRQTFGIKSLKDFERENIKIEILTKLSDLEAY